ncbi:GL23927 [Drosophila persimilis]|uniref:GL23927 n=1 Tax=Drosophila persimilis TaxID=7234 RepID=B4G2L4_DROPE|nr:nucleolar protein 14 homolog [Drosophila persimilis]EDW24059.1 GL23927 [Drosophila persimilis]
MGAKNKRANADAVYAKKTVKSSNPFDSATAQSAKRQNPFDVHVNKEKFKILGRICKHDRGMPGVARSKALQKRTQTLGQQFAVKHKTNKFKDNRIGRHLSGDQLTESVMNARYLAEKMSQVRTSQKAQKFNLNDDELLTHRGQTLEEIEQYRDERSDDEELDDEALDADFTSAAHFGGDDNETSPHDRQVAIDEMIAEQKRRKNEIDKEKNEVYDLTEKLDANYKLLLPLVAKATKDEEEAKPPADAYDKLLKEMIFEPRGSVTDKLINPVELAKQEAERLEKLENERLRRMRAEGEEDPAASAQPKHRSADDLDDGYFVAGGEDDGDDTLAYDLDGNLGTHLSGKAPAKEASGDEDEEADGDDDGEEEDSEDDSESEAENYSDLDESEAESETEEASAEPTQRKPKKEKLKAPATTEDSSIPFTIKMPKSYEDFTELLSRHAVAQQATIVERIIKCNDPKLDGVNRENVVKLYCFLLQYLKDLFEDASEQDIRQHFQLLSRLMPHLYTLTQMNPERMSSALLDVIKEKFGDHRKNSKTYPTLDTLVYFKLVSNVYSTSDFRHPVATPTYVFMEHILSRARVRTRQDIAMGLFVVAIALEFGSQSKRFLPSVFNFLEGILYIAIPKRDADELVVTPPFDLDGPFSKLLAIPATAESKALEHQKLQAADLVTHTITLDFKVRALDTALCLIQEALQLVGEHTGACYLASPFIPLLARLRLKPYPEHVHQHHREASQLAKQLAEQKMKPVALAERKPKALRMLEPRFETVYDDKRRPKMSKEKEERAKLLHKIKREKKGAIREIRRDTAFVQELKLKQQLQSDKERHEKVKRIYQEASMQQGELNELARSKKRKK